MSEESIDESAIDWDVNMSGEIADSAEALLREFATEAELDIALVVEKSGGLIAGVTAREDVDVATIGALVAGAFGTMGALSRELGEIELTESFHHGEDDLLYLRQLGERYIMLGAASAAHPAGLIREAAAQVSGKLEKLLLDSDEPGNAESEPEEAFAAEVEESPFQAADAGDTSEDAVPDQTGPATEEVQAVPLPAIGPKVRNADSDPGAEKGDDADASPAKGPRYVFEIG